MITAGLHNKMRGFRKLVILGVLLVTLLLVIDTIDAGRKQEKKKELENGKSYEQENSKFTSKNKHSESTRYDKLKKAGFGRTEDYEEENQYVSKDPRFDSKKPDLKRNIKFTSKEKKITENEKSKTSKHFQKFKKSKVMEKEAGERIDSTKAKGKKSKPQYLRSENVDKIVKTVKKTSQKKLFEENEDVEKMLHDELDKLQDEETISVEETVGGNSKKRKYKLVEVVLEEDGQDEDSEGNETTSELGSENQEFVVVEIEEKSRSTQNPKQYKNKKSSKKYNTVEQEQDDKSASEDNYFNNTEETSEQEITERMPSEVDSFSGRYVDPAAESCQRLPEDPNRQGPKKLTLYVVEEEIDGKIKKRVVTEEDGVTMCEVADLLKETYNMDIPEE